jgi:hypothetical protein
MLGQIAAPCGEVGPIRINLAPNFAEAGAAQGFELGAHGLDAGAENAELIAVGPLVAKQHSESLRLLKRHRKFGKPVRPGTRDRFG